MHAWEKGITMSILILTNHLNIFAGSEIQALEVYEYFKQQGHDVKVYANTRSEPMISLFQPSDLIAEIADIDLTRFDLVWAQHSLLGRLFKDHDYKQLKLALVSVHLSPFELLELSSLPYMSQLADIFIANSNETKQKLLEFGIDEEKILVSGNPAPDSFKRTREAGRLKNVLVVSNHAPQELKDAADILQTRGISVDFLGQGGQKQQRVDADLLAKYDVIATIGKTVQYALLGQIPVYNYDHFGGCGYLNAENFEKARNLNFSGRGFGKKTAQTIADEIEHDFSDSIAFIRSLNTDSLLLSAFMEKVLSKAKPKVFTQQQLNRIKTSYPLEERFTTTAVHAQNLEAMVTQQKDQLTLLQQKQDTMSQIIQDKENHIQNIHETINGSNGVITTLNQSLNKADVQSEALQKNIDRLTKKLADKEQLLQNTTQQLHAKDVHINNIEAMLTQQRNEAAKLQQYNQSFSYKLVKPLFALERCIKSANHYRKAFRCLVKEKGSIGKAYQFLRHMYLDSDLKTVKRFLKNIFTAPQLPTQMLNDVPTWSNTFDINDKAAYQKWIRTNNMPSEHDIAAMRREAKAFEYAPKISILMPVYNVDTKWLALAIDSVRNQYYENWELCIADDASPNADIRPLLEQYAADDRRIKVVFREQNGHISENSNSALALCSGEWTALMDHDDLLPPNALFEVVKALQAQPDAALVYTDEDKIDENGVRFMPHFKSDFNLDLLYGQNYISHLGVYRTDIAKKIGGFRKGLEGSQDYDFLLRYLLKTDNSKVLHIPKVLYHWRAIEGSTALAAGEKSYTTEAGIKALQNYFAELGKDVTVTRGKADNLYRVQWHWKEQPLVSLIIPTYNGYQITKQAIDSILDKTTYPNYEILLVDNNSDDPQALAYFDEIAEHEKVTLLRYPYPFNYSAINNFAAKQANGEIIGLINNDIEVINGDWLTEMVTQAQRPDIGCIGAMLYYPNDKVQHAGVIIGIGSVAGHAHKYFTRNHHGYYSRLQLVQNFMAVTAACLLVRKDVFNKVGGLNEKDLTVAFNDVDFCLKVHAAGYRNLWTPYAELYHHESISRGHEDNPEKQARFQREIQYMLDTWHTDTLQDPYYNPNLTLTREDFSISLISRVPS